MDYVDTIPTTSWVAVASVLVASFSLIAGFVYVKQRYNIPPEVPRKVVHMVMALLFVAIPWFIDTLAPGAALALIGFAFIVGLRIAGRHQWRIGQVIHHTGNRPKGIGDLVFPAGPFIVFYMSQGNPTLYCLPMLYLALADPLACFVGTVANAKSQDDASRGKTWQGSAAFFVTVFVCTLIVLTAFSSLILTQALLVSLLVGTTLTFVEALSYFGIDNLTVPLGGHLLLRYLLEQNSATLLVFTALTSSMLIAFVLLRFRSNKAVQLGVPLFLFSTSFLVASTLSQGLSGHHLCVV